MVPPDRACTSQVRLPVTHRGAISSLSAPAKRQLTCSSVPQTTNSGKRLYRLYIARNMLSPLSGATSPFHGHRARPLNRTRTHENELCRTIRKPRWRKMAAAYRRRRTACCAPCSERRFGRQCVGDVRGGFSVIGSSNAATRRYASIDSATRSQWPEFGSLLVR